MILRGASGYSDSAYIYPIVKRIAKKRNDVIVLSNYPEFFSSLSNVKVESFDRRRGVDLDISYVRRRAIEETTTWEDTCLEAWMPDFVSSENFTLDFKPFDKTVKRSVLIRTPYIPTWVMPCDYFKPDEIFISTLACELQAHHGIKVKRIPSQASYNVTQWYNMYSEHDLIITQSSSNFVLAEMMGLKTMLVFNYRQHESQRQFVKWVVPKKVICKPELTRWCLDNYSVEKVAKEISEFINK